MSSDKVRRAVQAQRDELDDTRIKRQNAKKIAEQIMVEKPITATKMDEHDFPLYLRRSFEQRPVRIKGELKDIWLIKIGADHKRIAARSGFSSVAIEDGGPEAGVVFAQSKSGETIKAVILMRPREDVGFRVLKDENDLMELAPVQLVAIRALLKEMQEKPREPVEYVPWIEPPKTKAEWHQPVKKSQP
jgi:hypothetical protein